MTAPALLCATLEVALNRYLGLEPAVLGECESLSGRAIELASTMPPWSLYIEFHRGGVRVLSERDAGDVSVSGTPGQLLRLLGSVAQGRSGLPEGLRIDGDVELLRRFNRMLARVGFDPEEIASQWLGDAPAHRLLGTVRSVLGWGRRTADTLALDTAEYLREETRDLARGADVDEWMDDVDRLRDDVARFEARLQRLEPESES